jgi:PAS domain S-box-containing protein
VNVPAADIDQHLDVPAPLDAHGAYERAATHVRLLQEVAVAANEASQLEEALGKALDCVCRTAGWPLGHVYLTSERDPSLLEPSGIWHDESGGSFGDFRAITAETPQSAGVGLAGLVLADAKPHWLTARTAAKRGMPRAEAAAHDRIDSGFAFPVIVNGEVAGVLEFFSTEKLSPDEHLLDVTASIGRQLGRVIERKRAERALRQAETKYRVLVEQLPIALYAFGLDDRHAPIYRSPQVVSLLGYGLEEWQADPDLFPKLLHPEDRDRVMAQVEHVERTGDPFTDEYRLQAKDGRTIWVRDENLTIFDTDGRPLYRQGFMQDITERRRSEELRELAETRYRMLVEQLPLTVYLDALDEASSAIYMSPQIENVLGYTVDEWLADRQLFDRLLHPDDRERVLAEHARSQRSGEPLQTRYRLVAKDGRVVWFDDSSVVVTDAAGSKLYRQGYMLDITAQQHTEEERERLLEQVQERVSDASSSSRHSQASP